MGFCFPGQDAKGADLPPRRECAPAWRAPLMAAMPQIELVLTIGLYAQAWHLGDARRGSLTETVRDWRAIFDARRRPRVMPLPHPSWRNTGWLKQNPWFETDLLPFLQDGNSQQDRRGLAQRDALKSVCLREFRSCFAAEI